jgi:DNA polymerase III subunit alpha
MSKFTHLHNHTQYSILDGASKINDLFRRSVELDMNAVAMTDHGNMYGVMDFVMNSKKYGVKPIIGVETYVARNAFDKKSGLEDRSGYHLILLAKNFAGYKNLIKLVSRSFTEGFYYTPRIDKNWLKGNTEGIIASSACLGGEIPKMILTKGVEEAEKSLQFYLDHFGNDFYLEMQNHGIPEQVEVNKALHTMSQKYGVKLLATNDVHFVMKDDYEAHKLLIAINTGKDINEDTLHYTGNEYLKSYEEMHDRFKEFPEALANSVLISDSIEKFELERKVIMPVFPIPESFQDDDEYLKHISYEGAKERYVEITDEVKERIDFELEVIKNMGFAGYFLIVSDLIKAARENDVLVGPGRGSAAGSAIAYVVGITNIDPLKYNLLFERFLNPERISMPDIDIDFDDAGREKVFEYVINKYGRDKVAQIVTFGTLGSRSSIRDVARVLGADLSTADRIAKLIPEGTEMTIEKALKESPDFKSILEKGTEMEVRIIENAKKLEGLIRQTGVHACGTIIGRDALMNDVPLARAKDSDLPVTQYEGSLVEAAGMLKMDFLGLKTLSIMKSASEIIKARHNFEVVYDDIPLDDPKTFELFQRGDTIGIFQFESPGMRKWLSLLKPTHIEDLIAMNALYRPGPMEFIQLFVDRKNGVKKLEYPHELLEPILKDTNGIMVYQEQIMQAAQILGGYTLGSADILRRAMGKKKTEEMAKQRAVFLEGAKRLHDIDAVVGNRIFSQIEEFAKYGFNKSHSAAYSVLAFQTAWIKAHYPAEYMAAVLTHNLNDLKNITFFVEETKRQGIDVLGPDVNESYKYFSVTKDGRIRFGLAALKNVGEAAAENLIEERKINGNYLSIQDFLKRLNTRNVNKRCIEALAYSGAFDSFGIHRAQFFYKENETSVPFVDVMMRHASHLQNIAASNQQSLFGDSEEAAMPDLVFPQCEPFTQFEELKLEKEYSGFYIKAHPLEQYKLLLNKFCSGNLEMLKTAYNDGAEASFSIAGLVTGSQERLSKQNTKWGYISIEDETGSYDLTLFGEQYLKFKHFAEIGIFVFVEVKVQKHYKTGRIEVRVQNISQLSDVEDKIQSSVVVIHTEHLKKHASEIVQTIKKGKGKISLKLSVVGKGSNGDDAGCSLNLKGHKVNLDVLKHLEALGCIVQSLKA